LSTISISLGFEEEENRRKVEERSKRYIETKKQRDSSYYVTELIM